MGGILDPIQRRILLFSLQERRIFITDDYDDYYDHEDDVRSPPRGRVRTTRDGGGGRKNGGDHYPTRLVPAPVRLRRLHPTDHRGAGGRGGRRLHPPWLLLCRR